MHVFIQKLQYVLVKILSTIAVIVLGSLGLFHAGVWSWNSGYAYIAIVMNLSTAYALYCLVMLYYATRDDLKEWRPVGKFLCIKGVVREFASKASLPSDNDLVFQ